MPETESWRVPFTFPEAVLVKHSTRTKSASGLASLLNATGLEKTTSSSDALSMAWYLQLIKRSRRPTSRAAFRSTNPPSARVSHGSGLQSTGESVLTKSLVMWSKGS